MLSLNRANPITKTRLRQIDKTAGPLSDFHSLQYANNVRQPLSVNFIQTLTHCPGTSVLIPKPLAHRRRGLVQQGLSVAIYFTASIQLG